MRSIKRYRALISAMLLAALGILLPGCATTKFGTYTAAGAAFPRAQYQVLGRTKYDQTWIDKTTEAEIAGFGFARPAKRPVALSARPTSQQVVITPQVKPVIPVLTPATPAVVSVAPKKPTLRERLELLNEKVRKLEGKK